MPFSNVSAVEATHEANQRALSANLAAAHPDANLTCKLIYEIAQRLDGVSHRSRRQMFEIILPWLRQQKLSKLKPEQLTDHVKMLLFLTNKYLSDYPTEMEHLWDAVAHGAPDNSERILASLIDIGRSKHNSQYLLQAKRACVYLGRAEPDAAIRALVQFQPEAAVAPAAPVASPPVEPTGRNRSVSESSVTPTPRGDIDQAGLTKGTKIESDFMLLMETLDTRQGGKGDEDGSHSPTISVSDSRKKKKPAAESEDMDDADAGSSDDSDTDSMDIDVGLVTGRAAAARGAAHPFDEIVPSLVSDWDLSVDQFRVVFLAQLSYEISLEFRAHLALLFHFIVLQLDHQIQLVCDPCRLILLNLVEQLVVQPLQNARSKGPLDPQQLAALMEGHALLSYLHGKANQQFWANEDTSLKSMQPHSSIELTRLVQSLRVAFDEERSLPADWAAESLRWAVRSSALHTACRSYQVYRALSPALTKQSVTDLLSSLLRALVASRTHQHQLGLVSEMLLTLRTVVSDLSSHKLLLYPQLFWCAVAVLHTDFEAHYSLALKIVDHIIASLDFRDQYIQNIYDASIPRGTIYAQLFFVLHGPHAFA